MKNFFKWFFMADTIHQYGGAILLTLGMYFLIAIHPYYFFIDGPIGVRILMWAILVAFTIALCIHIKQSYKAYKNDLQNKKE